ncbi:hypothetical protein [Vibrio coralliilyticus]|uniref:hypothetical protein n=1 Tax=Vibrio coralliilyticus TaxID=190893 RepID=UPI0015614004|nr:hypothetical protein [Vibrio coralliilyticus]NRF16511.1 hypothetical protein [Vibrio coralliilyticus]
MNKSNLSLCLLVLLSILFYPNAEAKDSEFEQAWSKCRGYEEASVLTYEDGRIETICTPRKYDESTEDLTEVFEKMYFKCGDGDNPLCLANAVYYIEQNTTLVNFKLELAPYLERELVENSGLDREQIAKSYSESVIKLLVLTLNPKLGEVFHMEADYEETIEFLDSPYSLDTVSIGVVAHDGDKRYTGYATSDKYTGYLSYSVEDNAFATPAQLLFYHCDFSVECETTTTVEVVETK